MVATATPLKVEIDEILNVMTCLKVVYVDIVPLSVLIPPCYQVLCLLVAKDLDLWTLHSVCQPC